MSLAVRRKFFILTMLTLALMFNVLSQQSNSELIERRSLQNSSSVGCDMAESF